MNHGPIHGYAAMNHGPIHGYAAMDHGPIHGYAAMNHGDGDAQQQAGSSRGWIDGMIEPPPNKRFCPENGR